MRRLALLVCTALAASSPRPAVAEIEDVIGLGARATALGGALVARPGHFAAVYYNPAALLDARPADATNAGEQTEPTTAELSLGLVFARPFLDVDDFAGRPLDASATTPDTAGLLLGFRADVGEAVGLEHGDLALGLSLFWPRDLFRWEIRPDEQLQWAFWTDRTQVIGFNAGAAARPLPWLTVGVGLRVLFDVETFTVGRVVEVEQIVDPLTGAPLLDVDTQLGENVTVYGRASPTAGVMVAPWPAVRIGLVYRAENLADDWGDTRISGVPGLGDLGYVHHFAHYQQPHQVALGVGLAASAAVRLSADLTWRHWSEGLSTYRNSFGPGRWGDTWSPACGVSWAMVHGIELLGGYRFEPSPLDNFGGPTNLLDNDRHVGSLGMTLAFADLLGDPDLGYRLSWAVQTSWLVEQEEIKDWRRFRSDEQMTANPGYPGYHYGGVVAAGVIELEVAW